MDEINLNTFSKLSKPLFIQHLSFPSKMFKVKLLICICRVFFPLHQFTNNKVWKTIYKDDWYCYTQNKRTISIWPSSLRPLSRSIITKQLKPQSQYNENTVGWHRTVFWSAFWIPQSHTQIRSICPPTVKIMSSLGVFLNSSLFIDACHYSKRKKKKKKTRKKLKKDPYFQGYFLLLNVIVAGNTEFVTLNPVDSGSNATPSPGLRIQGTCSLEF